MLNLKHLKPSKLVLIGASTGGPKDIKTILKSISNNFDACIVIAQHMGDEFMPSFASRIDTNTHLEVKVAEDGEVLKEKTIYIASKHCHITKQRDALHFEITTSKTDTYNPNINELFTSCAAFANDMEVLACILTGIGDDGAKGVAKLCTTNASCITENKASSAVYGMPQRAKEASPKVKVLSLEEIVNTINQFGES